MRPQIELYIRINHIGSMDRFFNRSMIYSAKTCCRSCPYTIWQGALDLLLGQTLLLRIKTGTARMSSNGQRQHVLVPPVVCLLVEGSRTPCRDIGGEKDGIYPVRGKEIARSIYLNLPVRSCLISSFKGSSTSHRIKPSSSATPGPGPVRRRSSSSSAQCPRAHIRRCLGNRCHACVSPSFPLRAPCRRR